MRKAFAAVALAVALVVSAVPAHASDPAGLKDCPPGYGGLVVYALGLETHLFCSPWGP